MNADQRFKALLLRYPAITTDFDAHGILTDEAAKRPATGRGNNCPRPNARSLRRNTRSNSGWRKPFG